MNLNSTNMNETSGDAESQLDAAISTVTSEPIDSGAVDRIRQRAKNLATEQSKILDRPVKQSRFPRRRWLQLATLVACVLIVAGLVMPLGSTHSSSAFAQVIEQLKMKGAFSYSNFIYLEDQELPVVSKEMVAEDGRARSESGNSIIISDKNGLPLLFLDTEMKTASVSEPEDSDLGVNQIEWLESLAATESPHRLLGKKQLDGQDCEGFVVGVEDNEINVWVVAGTAELVQIEMLWKRSSATKTVMKDFKFNLSFDESMFQLDVPDGYEVSSLDDLADLPSDEEAMVNGLRAFTKLSGGKFQKKLNDWYEWISLLTESSLSPEEKDAFTRDMTGNFSFIAGMSKKDFGYTGEGVSISDDKVIVFWYRTKEDQLRAIYNDFSIADIDESELPKK